MELLLLLLFTLKYDMCRFTHSCMHPNNITSAYKNVLFITESNSESKYLSNLDVYKARSSFQFRFK
jgi:hypothetical protein